MERMWFQGSLIISTSLMMASWVSVSSRSVHLCESEIDDCMVATNSGNYSKLNFTYADIYFGNASTVEFICDSNSCRGARIHCPENEGTCDIICDNPTNYICYGVTIYSEQTKFLSISCDEASSGCKYITVYGPQNITNSNVSIICNTYDTCRSGSYYLNFTDKISIECSGNGPNVGDIFLSACQGSKYYMQYTKYAVVDCDDTDCNYATFYVNYAVYADISLDGSYNTGISVYCKENKITMDDDNDDYTCRNPTPKPTEVVNSNNTVGSDSDSEANDVSITWILFLLISIQSLHVVF